MSVGDGVLDGFKQTESWVDRGIEWLDDLADFYKERALIEREAAQKLESLTSKHFAKKASASVAVSVGQHPLTTPGSLESMSLQAWTETLNQTSKMASERLELANALYHGVSSELSTTQTRFEDLLKYYKKFYESIEERRDKTYQHLKKAKHHYDATCESLETARAKSKKSVEAREHEMHNAKNSYLVQINIANRMKDKYYHDDLPELLDALQRVNEARVKETNRILKNAGDYEIFHWSSCISALESALGTLAKNDPKLDSHMFVEHNANAMQWQDPPDFLFEPSPIWHDNDEMFARTEEAQRYLAARLGEANTKSVSATAESERALKVFEEAKQGVASADFGSMPATQAAPLLRSEASALKRLVEAETDRLEIEVEIEAIEAATAAIDLSHVPQARLKTQRTLFGRKKEVVELVRDGSNAGHSNRSLGLTSLLARTSLKHADDGGAKANVLYAFEAGAPGELSVNPGTVLDLVAADDGSGWVRLSNGTDEGLVPASYVEVLFGGRELGGGGSSAAPPPPPPSRGSQDRKMVALYDFDGAEGQLSIRANDVITVLNDDDGTGWTTGVLNGAKGIFPTSYARPA